MNTYNILKCPKFGENVMTSLMYYMGWNCKILPTDTSSMYGESLKCTLFYSYLGEHSFHSIVII